MKAMPLSTAAPQAPHKKAPTAPSAPKIIFRTDGRSETLSLAAGESLLYVFFTQHVGGATNATAGTPTPVAPATAAVGDAKDQELKFILQGRQAHIEVIGIDVARTGAAKVKLTIEHAQGDTRSQAQVKSVLGGNAHGEVHGLIKIDKGADGSDAYFAHRTLLLANAAGKEQPHNHTVPALEIEANEVKAGHASTTGTFDIMDIFYLLTRGLSEEQAQQLVLEGFVLSALEKIADVTTREQAIKAAETRLAQLQEIR
ncbi:MAG: hypothetical protein A3F54_02025 [Candidatus Kerfeldbacteria bacterium RIFCSPHIGHO2_12_FULL_48_17]|uniref:SUF system FeS cluster assembly SufBD core domain-containing protein n=1 Tax=Candidatus Kerfeldbacteria bacterium RIFCSPHIGHO2_12_FULL_48_17 TaxID=1798542 RepID=A0A1G2AY22_9BACT|nr:MAG: hypothetical protein A3F54_02025 [Candidatus Kerfeldbacteria bacterium RIFCSPHIGHO2_12_FULL_48_17]